MCLIKHEGLRLHLAQQLETSAMRVQVCATCMGIPVYKHMCTRTHLCHHGNDVAIMGNGDNRTVSCGLLVMVSVYQS